MPLTSCRHMRFYPDAQTRWYVEPITRESNNQDIRHIGVFYTSGRPIEVKIAPWHLIDIRDPFRNHFDGMADWPTDGKDQNGQKIVCSQEINWKKTIATINFLEKYRQYTQQSLDDYSYQRWLQLQDEAYMSRPRAEAPLIQDYCWTPFLGNQTFFQIEFTRPTLVNLIVDDIFRPVHLNRIKEGSQEKPEMPFEEVLKHLRLHEPYHLVIRNVVDYEVNYRAMNQPELHDISVQWHPEHLRTLVVTTYDAVLEVMPLCHYLEVDEKRLAKNIYLPSCNKSQ